MRSFGLDAAARWTMSSPRSDGKVSLAIGNTIAEMAKVVDFVDQFCAVHNISQGIANDFNVCLDELLNNTISYGYEDQRRHDIVVTLSLKDDLLIAEIQDDGKPFDPRTFQSAAPGGALQARRIGGLGIHFVKTLMDEVGYKRSGRNNVVSISKKLRGGRADGDS